MSYVFKERNPRKEQVISTVKLLGLAFVVITCIVLLALEFKNAEIWYSLLMYCIFSLVGLKPKNHKVTLKESDPAVKEAKKEAYLPTFDLQSMPTSIPTPETPPPSPPNLTRAKLKKNVGKESAGNKAGEKCN